MQHYGITRRIISFSLVLFLVLSLMPSGSLAVGVVASGTCGKDLTWGLDSEGTLTISGTGPMDDYSNIAALPWYRNISGIQSIVLSEGITRIGDFAFCTVDITGVVLPASVTSIGNKAFFMCRSLLSFAVDANSQYLTMDASGALYTKDKTTLIQYPAGRSETSYNIMEGVTSIGDYAFNNCRSLTSVVIPASVNEIGENAFYSCTSLTHMDIPESVTRIGEEAFCGCGKLMSFTVSENSRDYVADDHGVLYNKSKTELIQYPAARSETSYTISDGVLSIGASAFYNCDNLTSIVIPTSVTRIGETAFAGCSSLTNLDIPDGVTTLGQSAFQFCSNLTSVVIPTGVTSIEKELFYYCRSLTNVVIPENVRSIGNMAFYACASLTDVNIPTSVTSIGDSAFSGCISLISVVIPAGVRSIGREAFKSDGSITSVTIPACVSSIKDVFPDSYATLTHAGVAEGVTSIKDNTFNGCSNLSKVDIPESVKSIGSHAFEFCSSLTGVEIPAKVTSIGDFAFYGCNSLTGITIPANVSRIGENAFYGCSSLRSFTVDPDNPYYSADANGALYNKDKTALIQSPVGHVGMDNFSRSRTYDNTFSDVMPSAWYYESVVTAYELGLIEGVGNGLFDPNGYVTVAQAITIASRLCDIYTDDLYDFTGGDPWYKNYVDYARKKGLISDAQFWENYPYSAVAERGDIAGIFGALPGDLLPVINQVSAGAIPDVDPGRWYAPSVYLLYQAGIFEGKDADGAFDPNGSIKRSEMAAIVSRIAAQNQRKSYSLTPEIVTVYADDGETRQIPASKLTEFCSFGWQTKPIRLSRDDSAQTLLNSATLNPMKTNYAELDGMIDQIFSSILSDNMTTYEKTKACYDYLIEHTEYGHDLREYTSFGLNVHYNWPDYDADSEHAEGSVFLPMKNSVKDQFCALEAMYLLKTGRGDCQAYADAFLVMTRRIGLKSYICEGVAPRADGSGKGRHVWNTITIGGMDFAFDAEVEDKIAGGGSPTSTRFCRKFEVLTSYHDYDIEKGKSYFGGFEVFRFD